MPKKNTKYTFIDLFAGAGGLSEGFIRAGFLPIAHVEMDENSCSTLLTRLAFHYLAKNNMQHIYFAYLQKQITRNELWNCLTDYTKQTVINKEITSKTIKDIFESIDSKLGDRKVDVIIGGPPCQAYSLVGRSRDENGMKWDRRNFLFRYYADFLIKYKPKFFVFENVLGLLSAGNKKYFNEMLHLFEECGYKTAFKVLNSEDYGVLQKRKRVIIMGERNVKEFTFPDILTINNTWEIKKDLFYDLPVLKPGDELGIAEYTAPINSYLSTTGIRNGVNFVTQNITRSHNIRDLTIYTLAVNKWINDKVRLKYNDVPEELRTHENTDSFLDRYKVVDPFGHSHTVVAHIAKDGHYYIYPDLKQIRSLSVREAARIQSFPDDFYFEGGRTAAFRQIGNAVPPLMAEKIAKKIYQLT